MAMKTWEKFPEQQRKFIPFIEKYGAYQFEQDVYDKLDRLTKREKQEIQTVIAELDASAFAALNEWIDHCGGLTKNEAAALTHFAMAFLAHGNEGGFFK